MKERQDIIIRASWVAILGNMILAIMKLLVGIISQSYAVIGDGIDSTTDVASSVVILIAARIISRPPNVKFPYGYQKADTVATKILSFVIFFAGAQLAITTLKILIFKEPSVIPSPLAIYIIAISIVGKIFLSYYLSRSGKRTNSNMLIANAKNMRNDILISLSVLIGLVFTLYLELPVIDKIIALLLSGFIMKVAFQMFMQTNVELMDGIEDTQLYNQLFEAVKKVEGASNPHRVRARKIGSHYMVNLDIEVDPDLSVRSAHKIAMQVENSIKSNLNNIYDVMVHVEPRGNLEENEKYGIRESDIKTD